MNSPVVRSASRAFAGAPGAARRPRTRCGAATRWPSGRAPTADELADAVAFLREQRASYQGEKKADAAALALADFCQVLLGLNEFMYIDMRPGPSRRDSSLTSYES